MVIINIVIVVVVVSSYKFLRDERKVCLYLVGEDVVVSAFHAYHAHIIMLGPAPLCPAYETTLQLRITWYIIIRNSAEIIL